MQSHGRLGRRGDRRIAMMIQGKVSNGDSRKGTLVKVHGGRDDDPDIAEPEK
jgi:hypothetical protein